MSLKLMIKVFLCFLFALVGSYIIYHLPVRENVSMRKIDLSRYKNVMFVAHPDDDMFWGGAHLIEDDYLVVCITCGGDRERLDEFKKVMDETGDSFIALGYPDKTFGERNDWNLFYGLISWEVERILNRNNWEKIVVHNPDGEYGHIHHKKINKIVMDIYNKNNYSSKLYYFGKYYSKNKIVEVEDVLVPISDELYERKLEIIDLYKSQSSVRDKMIHMFKYEMWEEYKGE